MTTSKLLATGGNVAAIAEYAHRAATVLSAWDTLIANGYVHPPCSKNPRASEKARESGARLDGHPVAAGVNPEQIKAEIRMRDTTPAAIADALQLSRMTVSNVIHGRVTSRRVADRIAEVIGKPVSTIWPGRYLPAGTRRRRVA